MFFSRSKGEVQLILDIQSSIVRGTLVHTLEGQSPRVLCTSNIDIPFKARSRSSYLVKAALKAVSDTIQGSLRYLQSRSPEDLIPRNISSIHYVLSSPWILSQAKTLTLSFDTETDIDREYIMKLVADERAKLTEKHTDVSIVEEKVFDVRLNGYSIPSWESRQTRELAVSFVVSVAGTRTIDRFIEAGDVAVRKSQIHFHSSLFLQHTAIQKVMPSYANYALVHVHGELTDVAIIHNHSCVFFGSYPFGINSVIRNIAEEGKIDPQTAESVLTMSVHGHLDGVHAKSEKIIIDNMSQGWIGEFRKLMKTNTPSTVLPHEIIISARSHEDFFLKSFTEAYPHAEIKPLSIEDIKKHVVYEQQAEQLRLTGLYVVAVNDFEK